MRWLDVMAAVAAVYLAGIWAFQGFNNLPQVYVKLMLAIALLRTTFEGIVASLGYKLETKAVKIKE